MAITERQIRVSKRHIPANRKPRKSFPTIAKSLGDHIQIRRVEKGLSQAELAQQMGVEKAALRSLEEDLALPNEVEWQILEALLNLDASLKPTQSNT